MDYPNFRLDGQTAVVTGASKGLGRGIAAALANAGAQVAALARSESELASLVAEIEAEGGSARPYLCDVADIGTLPDVMAQIRDDFGSLDVLVNNAGLGDNHPAEDVTEADWDGMMTVNLKGLFFCAQAAGRLMLEAGSGRIVNMSSQAGSVGIRDHAVYCATKGGVDQLTRVLALEWGGRGVNVNAIGPTFIYTPGTAERLDDPAYHAKVVERIPLGRVGTMTDVAAAVLYLASPAGGLVNGAILLIDGGWTAQ